MLSDHEHVIDCIAWANSEAARIIENATYNGGSGNPGDEQNEEEAEGGLNDTVDTVGAAGGSELDESRANLTTRLTTKERI